MRRARGFPPHLIGNHSSGKFSSGCNDEHIFLKASLNSTGKWTRLCVTLVFLHISGWTCSALILLPLIPTLFLFRKLNPPLPLAFARAWNKFARCAQMLQFDWLCLINRTVSSEQTQATRTREDQQQVIKVSAFILTVYYIYTNTQLATFSVYSLQKYKFQLCNCFRSRTEYLHLYLSMFWFC